MSDLKVGNVVYHRGLLERWPLDRNPEFKVESITDDGTHAGVKIFTDGAEPFSGRGKKWNSIPVEKLLKVDDFTEEDAKYEESQI